ncbi:MAG TPA: hypothetical protein VGY58_17695 [Gemmataceae bacterium]|jgi:hypothetical protein|nr:hypothetical protein [Gemmataceae bacterium]
MRGDHGLADLIDALSAPAWADTTSFSSVSELVTALQAVVNSALTALHNAGSSSTVTTPCLSPFLFQALSTGRGPPLCYPHTTRTPE